MKSENGVSLIESLMVIAMVGIIVFLLANLPNAFSLINKSKHVSLAREIAAKQIEDKRAISFGNLTNDNSAIVDSRLSLLPGGSGSVVVEDCSAQICTNSEQIKLVTVTVFWKALDKIQSINLKTLIGQGGLNQ